MQRRHTFPAIPRQPAARYPAAGQWAKKSPAEVGMDATKLNAAVEFAKSRETNWPRDSSTQEKIFGSLLGPLNSYADVDGKRIVWCYHGGGRDRFFRQVIDAIQMATTSQG